MTKYWHPKKIKMGTGSPGREYSDGFFYEEFPKLIIGKNIKMFDVACGSGYIREILFNLGYNVDYTGLDIKKHNNFDEYSQYAPNSRFLESKIEDFNTNEKYDFIFSVSGLEHIKEDFSTITKISKFLAPKGVQVHSIPAPWSLPLYFKHGYRRYSSKRLRKMFTGQDLKIYRLGGLFSFLLHFIFITPSRLILGSRKKRGATYVSFLRLANKLDPIIPFFPSTHIVVAKNKTNDK